MSVEVKRSACPYDCPDTCGLLVTVENGVAVKVAGDPAHLFTRGSLCTKMAHYERTVHSPQRLTRPLIRNGPKGSGAFRPATWDEAIDHITGKWRDLTATYGAEAILPFSYAGTMGVVQRNAGHAFFHRMGASRLIRTICSSAKEYGWKTVMGNTQSLHPDEVKQSDLVILWGINAVATNIHFLHGVREAKKRGATVWLIDTYETPTAQVADKVFLTRPGSDGALALGIMHVLARDGLIDQAFLAASVQGFAELKADILPDYSPEVVSRITGLPAETITAMAHAYGAAKAPFIRLGSGLSRYGNGAMAVRTIACLPALVGAWTKPGGGLLANIATGSCLDSAQVTREDLLATPTRQININQLGDALTQPLDPPIKSLYVYHCNPAAVVPDQNKVLAGLSREDLFTVVHERFMTDTACYADVILPATTSLEHSDIFRAYGHYGVQRVFPVIPPVGEAKANWEVFCLLAQAMGFDEPVFRKNSEDMVEGLLAAPSDWLAQTNLDQFKAGQPVELPLPAGYQTKFKTPSGKIEIYNPAENPPLPCYFEPHGDDAPFWLVSSPYLSLLNSSFNERDDLLDNQTMALQMNPGDAAAKGLTDGARVVAFNSRGEVTYVLQVTPKAPAGVVVAEGVWWLKRAPGSRTVNALTSQRLTDKAEGSTFYDTKVDVRAE
ncbi:MAG: molybdopterin-dependent oxidoreductase [Negativicutes bacterium]|nr:molybdopterin-dependent oxidoreductase [Negativicutes bacterium]